MHVLVIPSERYLPADDPLAGIFQHDQASALQRAGVRTGILSVELRAPVLLKKRIFGWQSGHHVSKENAITVYRYHAWFRTPFWRSGYLRQYVREGLTLFSRYLAEQGRPDLIHAHNALRAGILAAEIKQRHGIPYIITEHSSSYSRGALQRGDIARVHQAFAQADRRFVVSRSLGLILEQYFDGEFGQWQVMPNMLDAVFEQPGSVHSRKADGCFTFLNIGGLLEIKRQDILLAAFACVFRDRNDICLRIVGDGPRRRELEKIARNQGVAEQVTFVGQVDRAGVLNELMKCDIYVHSSSSETFGVAIIEALACGKPVVSTASGGPDDIVTPENGRLVPAGDIEALAASMAYVLAHLDSYSSARIRKECLGRFSEQAVCKSLMAAYEEVVQEKRRS